MKSPQVGNEKMCNHVPQAMASTIVGVGPGLLMASRLCPFI